MNHKLKVALFNLIGWKHTDVDNTQDLTMLWKYGNVFLAELNMHCMHYMKLPLSSIAKHILHIFQENDGVQLVDRLMTLTRYSCRYI